MVGHLVPDLFRWPFEVNLVMFNLVSDEGKLDKLVGILQELSWIEEVCHFCLLLTQVNRDLLIHFVHGLLSFHQVLVPIVKVLLEKLLKLFDVDTETVLIVFDWTGQEA